MWQNFYFILTLILSSFLNFINLLYSNIDLFKVDLIENKKKDHLSFSKFSVIVKNNHLLFFSICIMQSVLSFFLSRKFELIFGNKLNNLWIIAFGITTTIFSEIIPNNIVGKEWSKNFVLNRLFLNIAYFIVMLSSPLKFFIKERKKFFTHRESDLVRFINNLTSKEILLLEPNEAKLVNLAFNLDDNDIRSILIPIEKTVCLDSSMTLKNIKAIYAEKGLTKYPVINCKTKDVVGILNIKSLVFFLLNKKGSKNWKLHINTETIFLKKETKLNKALEILRNSRSHIAVIKEGRMIFGIITLNDILGALVGKIYDEKVYKS
jgi:CBS domain containing-hemolysin-like protein